MRGKRIINFLLANFYNKRIFWICLLVISGWNMSTIFRLMIIRYTTDSTSIGLRTTYIHWSNTFPSISICLIKNKINKDFIAALNNRTASEKPLANTYMKTIYDYLFISSENSYIKDAYCKGYNATCGVNITQLRKQLLTQSCEDIFKEIYFADILLPNCDEVFKFHELEMGNCFLSNNLMDYKNKDLLPLRYSSLDKHRSLKLVLQSELIYKYQLYVHSPEDVPYFNAIGYLLSARPTVHNFNIEEVHNNDDVIEENVNQRQCKFPSETNSSLFIYSFSTCLSQIRHEMEMKTCNCTLFNPSLTIQTYCDVEGIKCLQEADISEKVKAYVGTNLVCLPSCMEQQIIYVGSIEKSDEGKDFTVEVQIASPPSARFYRIVTQTKLDLIVAVGGVIGLFIGASLLNIIEVISFCIHKVRNCYTN